MVLPVGIVPFVVVTSIAKGILPVRDVGARTTTGFLFW
jgi:hypothetical protein